MAKFIDPEEELMDGVIRMMESKTRCRYCKHFKEETETCEAFPDGVPLAFLLGDKVHDRKMFKQKNNIVFEKA